MTGAIEFLIALPRVAAGLFNEDEEVGQGILGTRISRSGRDSPFAVGRPVSIFVNDLGPSVFLGSSTNDGNTPQKASGSSFKSLLFLAPGSQVVGKLR